MTLSCKKPHETIVKFITCTLIVFIYRSNILIMYTIKTIIMVFCCLVEETYTYIRKPIVMHKLMQFIVSTCKYYSRLTLNHCFGIRNVIVVFIVILFSFHLKQFKYQFDSLLHFVIIALCYTIVCTMRHLSFQNT